MNIRRRVLFVECAAMRRNLSTVLVLLLGAVAFGCEDEMPVQTNGASTNQQAPMLADPIPFDRLGAGTLVFKRLSPPGGQYDGVYILDIGHRSSWGISGGVFEGPAVSPDGQNIAYTSLTSAPSYYDVYIMNIYGNNQRCVSNIVGQEHFPSWTFDGKQIMYVSYLFNPTATTYHPLYRQSPVWNPSDRVIVTDLGRIDPHYIYMMDGPASSARTGNIVFAAFGVRTMNADGGAMKLVIPASEEGGGPFSPAWSPDGSRFAALSFHFSESQKSSFIDVILYAADGSSPDTLVSLSVEAGTNWWTDNLNSLAWSPDGSQIAFTRPEGVELGTHIYLIGVDHTGLTQVTFAKGVTDYSLSWGR